jgi:hypothetical protein
MGVMMGVAIAGIRRTMISIGVIGIRDFASVRKTMEGLGMMGIDVMECLGDCIEFP